MKITITGSLGNISKPLAKQLIAAGHNVTVVSSNPDKKADIEALGATAAIGSIGDAEFLSSAFAGADVVYTMVPPSFAVNDYRKYASDFAHNYAAAIKSAGIKRIVNLSSIGADVDGGTGPIAGMHDAEHILNALPDVAIKHIRPGIFYVNLYANIGMIKNLGFNGGNYSADTRLVLVHPDDIASVIAEEIVSDFEGHSVRFVSSDESTAGEVTAALGAAIGKPDLKWVEFTDEQAIGGMIQAGLPEYFAHLYAEMNTALRNGILWTEYDAAGTKPTGKTKLADFAKEFAVVFGG